MCRGGEDGRSMGRTRAWVLKAQLCVLSTKGYGGCWRWESCNEWPCVHCSSVLVNEMNKGLVFCHGVLCVCFWRKEGGWANTMPFLLPVMRFENIDFPIILQAQIRRMRSHRPSQLRAQDTGPLPVRGSQEAAREPRPVTCLVEGYFAVAGRVDIGDELLDPQV